MRTSRDQSPTHDLAIIGSGAAAFAGAIAARREGLSVVMVERSTVGGTCVNVGCVPSKALLAAAEARRAAYTAGRFPGMAPTVAPVDFRALRDGTHGLVEALRTEKYADLVAHYGWRIVTGTGRFDEGPALDVIGADGESTRIEAEHYLIATGARPSVPQVPGLDRAGYLTSATALELDRLPASMSVVGGNAVGLETAQLFAHLGTRVTVVEAQSRLAPDEEPEISAAVAEVLADEGIAVHVGAELLRVRCADQHRADQCRVLSIRSGEGEFELRSEQVLVATGRGPVTDELNLAAIGVATGGRGEVIVDEELRTANPRVWAAGDVTGGPQFVYVAAAQGTTAVENALLGGRWTPDYTALPKVIFTTPAIASVGMTAEQAVAEGLVPDCRIVPLSHLPRALVDRNTRGLVKLVAEAETGRLLGAHVLAEGAGEVIAAAGYAIGLGLTVGQLAHAWVPYLTMAEGLKLAALAYTTDVAALSCCAG
ncbi:mercury(II) reductase [Pseudonocardia spinosispora]|uniref:mercury(II) reductase n=1 Tax=Pseudonocardia spinosispora TaxID=103441 RepID=UPI000420A574|nr:mercury(II) reductase [Pseudonocardia spinosispora]